MVSLYEYMKYKGRDYDVYDRELGEGTAMSIIDDPKDACGCVSDFILKNTELVGLPPDASLTADLWKFTAENYDRLQRVFDPRIVNDAYAMTSEDREENIARAVVCLLELIKGNAGNTPYEAFLSAFDLLPEDCVVCDFRIMDIDEYLAWQESHAYYPDPEDD